MLGPMLTGKFDADEDDRGFFSQMVDKAAGKAHDPDEAKKMEVIRASNKRVWAIMKKSAKNMTDAIKTIRNAIENLQTYFKGFIDLDDRKFFEWVEKEQLDPTEHQEQIRDKYDEILSENSDLKSQVADMEHELAQKVRKEQVFKTKLKELDLNYDESLHSVSELTLVYCKNQWAQGPSAAQGRRTRWGERVHLKPWATGTR